MEDKHYILKLLLRRNLSAVVKVKTRVKNELDQSEIENAPPILELEDEEKFHDTDGNILEIETRGERDVDKIFFRVRDVMKRFDMPNLNRILTDANGNYEIELHYKTFNRFDTLSSSVCIKSFKSFKREKSLFLTYTGLLRVLFVSRNKNAETFTIWATQKLFTMQMGSKEAKEILGTEVLNIKIENYRAVFGPIGTENNQVCHGRQTLVEL